MLDTSVLIALVDADDVHHPAARAAIEDGRAAGDRFVVPVAAYAEYMVRAFQHDPAEADFRDSIIEALPATVEAASRDIGREAAALRARYGRRLPLPDALIVGTAIRLGADQVLTADAGWPELDITVRILVAA